MRCEEKLEFYQNIFNKLFRDIRSTENTEELFDDERAEYRKLFDKINFISKEYKLKNDDFEKMFLILNQSEYPLLSKKKFLFNMVVVPVNTVQTTLGNAPYKMTRDFEDFDTDH